MTGLMFAHNLEDLAEGIGKLKGMSIGMSQKKYMSILITSAFHKANRRFNEVAAVSAKPRNFTHMYEFYTDKVHDNGTLVPTTQQARLWRTTLLGGGGRKEINFVFLPAKRPRTELTSEETGGIDEDVLKKLAVNNGKKYYWRNKAENTENMKHIYIKPTEAPALFIPLIQGLENPTDEERKQKFGFRKAFANVPGEWTGGGGKFRGFFFEYWNGVGGRYMEGAMIKKFNADVKKFSVDLKVSPSAPKPAGMVKVNAVAESNAAKTAKQWTIKALNEAEEMETIV